MGNDPVLDWTRDHPGSFNMALGFQAGVFHVEGKATSHGPHIIDVSFDP